ncbi:MAG TPA: hypothetical protein VMV49_00460 [Candidatus Deferrimicrobium sp.]|nr:hypothetical protein [Candidatus Deferrimicrobium sp.]
MGYLGFLIAGGAVGGEGGALLVMGLIYKAMFASEPILNFIWDIFIIIGIISLCIGIPFLIVGLVKRSRENI